MNILVFSWRDPKHPLAGGAEQVMHEHMKGWVEAGHEVTHFSSRIVGYPKKEEIIDGITMIRMGYQLLGVNILGVLWYLFGTHPKFDLVIDEFHGIPFFTPFFVRVKKIAVLQEVAREVWFKNQLPFPLNYAIGTIGFLGEPFLFLFYRNVPFIVGSPSAKRDLVGMGVLESSVRIIPHGVIIPKSLKKFPKEKTKTIIFLGALARDKGIEDAIEAFAILNKRGMYNFWIVGRGGEPYLTHLKKLVRQMGLSNNLKFWGFVSQAKKFELLAKSHVMINPSVREGWGLVNIEANKVGIPVVAYNSPGLVDSVNDGLSGIICRKNASQELAVEVETLLKRENLYRRLTVGARKWSKNFSWDESTKKSLDLINHSLGLK